MTDLHVHPRRLRVPHDVVQRFLHAAVERRLHGRRQPPLRRALHLDHQPTAFRHPVRQELQGGQESEVIEDGRPELVGQTPQLAFHLFQEILDGLQARARPRGELPRDLLQREMHRAEELACLVVERVGDPLRLLLQPLVQAPQRFLRALALGHIPRDALDPDRPPVLIDHGRVDLHGDPPPVPGHEVDLVAGVF